MSSAYDRLPLNALRVFEAVATRLNFSEAAEALNVTPAAVSQQIKALEDYLQTPLFRRNGRSIQLTPEATVLLPGVRRGLDELETALQRLKREREAGTVNISMLASFLHKWLTRRLANLHETLPEVDLRIHTSPDVVDFARTDFHAAIRLGRGQYPGLKVEKVMDDWLVAVAAPRLLKKLGPLPESGDLARYPLLHGTDLPWASWTAGDEQRRRAPRGAYFDDSAALLAAVAEGLGYAVLRWSLVADDLQEGRIVLASERVLPFPLSYYFIYPEAYTALPKLMAFRDWLLQQARAFPRPPELRQRPVPAAEASR